MPLAVTQITGLISFAIEIAGRVIRLAESARRNREKCGVLKRRVEKIRNLLTALLSQWAPDPVTRDLLQDLSDALDDGKALVESCQKKRTWSLVFRTNKKAHKFDALDKRISHTLEMFHIANMTLIANINRNNTNNNNYYNNNNDAPAAAAQTFASWSSASASAARDMKVVLDLADSMVQEARTMMISQQKNNREEIEQLVQFVKQVANLMKQLQYANLNPWWECNRETKPLLGPLLDGLKENLQQARHILDHHKQKQTHRILISSSRMVQDEPDLILKVAYEIEYYAQVLPVTMRQKHM